LRGALGFCLKATGNPTTLRTILVCGGRKGALEVVMPEGT